MTLNAAGGAVSSGSNALTYNERMAQLRQKAVFSAKTGEFNDRMSKLRELVKSSAAAAAGSVFVVGYQSGLSLARSLRQ